MMETMYYLLFFLDIIFFFFICYFMFVEESSTKPEGLSNEHIGNYRIAIPLIAINLIFLVLSAYGGYSIDYYSLNETMPMTYAIQHKPITDYAVWAVVFLVLFLIHILLLFKCGFDVMREGTYDPRNRYQQ